MKCVRLVRTVGGVVRICRPVAPRCGVKPVPSVFRLMLRGRLNKAVSESPRLVVLLHTFTCKFWLTTRVGVTAGPSLPLAPVVKVRVSLIKTL